MNLKNNVSVIIPMFNSCDTIERTLNSIQQQSGEFINIVYLVDDGSEDATINTVNKIIKRYEFPIKLLINPKKGVSSARNYGAHFVSTEWIAFLDADDMWLPDKFKKSTEYLSQLENVEMFGGRESTIPKYTKIHKISPKDMFIKYAPVIQTTVVKTNVFNAVSGFDETMSYAEDLDFAVKVAANFDVYLLPFKDFLTNPDKKRFGDSGLSENLKLMLDGIERTLKKSFEKKEIRLHEYCYLYFWNKAKYIRRILIVFVRSLL